MVSLGRLVERKFEPEQPGHPYTELCKHTQRAGPFIHHAQLLGRLDRLACSGAETARCLGRRVFGGGIGVGEYQRGVNEEVGSLKEGSVLLQHGQDTGGAEE